jgi:uncharacterized membrane protein
MIPSEKRFFIILSAGTVLWCGAFTLAPVFGPENPVAHGLRFFFSPICHQLPERSFHLFSEPMAVCSRCAGIYYGFMITLLAYPHIRGRLGRRMQSVKVLIWAALPMLIDVVLSALGILSKNVLHALTGSILGGVSTCSILPACLEWIVKKPVAEGTSYGTHAQ